MSQQRQLAAILFTDIEGYTALMQENEHKAVELINHYNAALNTMVSQYEGKILNNYGDGSLCSFSSVSHAMECAVDLQKELKEEPRVPLRIGLHVGEIILDDNKAMGDGVNVASRVQSLGQGNTILFSREVYDKIRNRPEWKAVSLGQFHFKNVQDPIEVFALANDGLNVPKRNKIKGKLKAKPGKKRRRIIALCALVIIIAGSWVYWNGIAKKKFSGKDKSIAVLPFVNRSGKAENEWVGDGMTDDIITRLYKIRSLRVTSRTSSMRYKGVPESLEKIADELNVASILEGGIQILGSQLKINVTLTDMASGNPIWSESFERDTSDLFEVQSEVAESIADHLNTNLNDSERKLLSKRPTDDIEAWNLYQQGRSYWYKRNESSVRIALKYFEQATQLDPNYARALSGLADCYSALGYGSFMKPADAFPQAEKFAESALKWDASLAEPHASLAYVKFYYYWDWAGAEKEFKEAIRLNPQYDWSHDAYAYFLAAQERFPEAMEEAKIAMEISPQPSPLITDMGFTLYYDKKYEEATANLLKAVEYTKGKSALAHVWLARTYQARKMYPEAISHNRDALIINPDWAVGLAGIGNIYGITGQKDSALFYLNKMFALSSTKYMTPYAFALIYTSLKDYDRAFEYLEKAYVDRANWLVWLKLDPRWDPIRSDKRYAPLVAKIGLPQPSANTVSR